MFSAKDLGFPTIELAAALANPAVRIGACRDTTRCRFPNFASATLILCAHPAEGPTFVNPFVALAVIETQIEPIAPYVAALSAVS